MLCTSLRLALSSSLAILLCYAQAVTVSIPLTAPSSARSISPSLIGLSIEGDRWLDWSGNKSRNEFFFNTLNNLAEITGQTPHLRIGADSADRTNFNPDVKFAELVFPPPTATSPYPEATEIVVGDGYYQAVQFLPPGTRVTWGLNFGDYNLTTIYLQTKSILKAFASSAVKRAGVVLDFFEIGNEVDIYAFTGHRGSDWNITQYVEQWTEFAANVTATANLASSKTRFWGCSFAIATHELTGFSPQLAFDQGLLSSIPGHLITTISQHLYEGSVCLGNGGSLQDLMSKAYVRSNLTLLSADIAAVHAQNLDFILGETNSFSCHGSPNVSNTAGAALWLLDHAFYAAQLGVSHLFFHDGIGFVYNLIQPATLTRSIIDGSDLPAPIAPHIQPPYYAAIIAGEAIGSSGDTTFAEIPIDDSRLAGYAFYEHGKLARALLINSEAFFLGTNRSSVHLNLEFADAGEKSAVSMIVKRLSIRYADDTSGLIWGGQTYETPNGLVEGRVNVSKAESSAGVDIQATEVILIIFA